MSAIRHVSVKDGDVLVMVGTMKGAFLLRSNAARVRWDVAGPYFQGQAVYAMAYDARAGRRRLWASTTNWHFGSVLRRSDDFGKAWTDPQEANVKFPEGAGLSLKNIWQIRPGRPSEPDVMYLGVEPASLFVSTDGGETWQLNQGLHDHPHRAKWEPGGGGLCLHTIVLDPTEPKKMTVAISTGGVYRTYDGGQTWRARNQGVTAEFLPDKNPEFGQCVHKIVMHPKHPNRFFLQNHWGLFKSEDGAESWQDMAKGVPSTFGFAMAIHPHDPEVVYIVPIESDMFRVMPEGKMRVYRTRDAGKSWEPLSRGLPQEGAFTAVLRDAMDVDALNPAGVYFGTRSGKVYGSPDGGASWSLIAEELPPVTCVRTAVIGDASRVRVPKPKAKARAKAKAKAARPAAKAAARPARQARKTAKRAQASTRPAKKRTPARTTAKRK
jgi:photosystem II stability/assembly factor-like uncharacterized protein